MAGPTRIELRRSNARALGLVVGVVAAAWFAGETGHWWRQWNSLAIVATSAMFVLAPLALAGGAMFGRRDGLTRADELISSTGRPRWHRVTPGIAALTIATTVGYLLVVTVDAVVVAVNGSYLGVAGLLSMLVDVTVLAGAVWVGIGVGRAWPSPMVPPALAVIGLVVQLAGDTITGPDGSATPLAALSMLVQPLGADWETASRAAVLGRLALGLGLLAGGALLTVGASRLIRAGGPVAVAAGVAVMMVVSPTAASRPTNQIDAAAQRLVCANNGPQVCVTAVHAYLLPSVVPQARAALTKLAKLPDAPTRIVEWHADTVGTGDDFDYLSDTPKTEPGTVFFRLDLADQDRDTDIEASILNGAGTTANGCRLNDPDALWAAGAWLAGGDTLDVKDFVFGLKLFPDDYQPVLRKLREAPEKEQIRRVTALRDAANACRTTNLTAILTGTSAA
ncbi:hypothetical protein [Cryptosporangium arvum]|uniref:ABC-type transport system involved in multi-copper enzyme maturation, permease component n=1 Tax=Cryptosporangium arvum DSM 44712 TaxID=927661 RepID=A0A010ZYT6_9ACTN|nr:hypothetical protein [Cryptosporangium arvum]EXG82372.1 hypothetical protein CryarDRAFT_3550 [Cryptosporangium arvum DSM 44712]